MKLKRLLASVLALLLVVSILPMTALAAEDNYEELLENTKEIDKNNNIIVENKGTVNKNQYRIDYNGTNEGGRKSGTVKNNTGDITNNYGTVENNKAGIPGTEQPTVSNNFGLVKENNGVVTNNQSTGEVTINNGGVGTNDYGGNKEGCGNYGTIGTNNGKVSNNFAGGTVGKKDEETGKIVEGTGNNGTIGTNNGTVISNNEDGKVEINGADGKIEINDGLVGIRNDAGDPTARESTGNFGNIDVNNGTVTTNDGGVIDVNNGVVGIMIDEEILTDDGIGNLGTVNTNNGMVTINGVDATVGTNNDIVFENYGKVETNTINGIVYNETTQDQNDQDVTGTVTNNYGTVYNLVPDNDGGSYYQATYGVEVKNTDGGAGTKLLQAVENTVVKLAELFKRDGYKLVGYDNITPTSEDSDEDADDPVAAAYALNNDPATSATEFQATRPSILKLLWEKIAGKPSAPSNEPETKTVQNNIPTSLSAGQVKVGTYVRRGNLLFRIIEVTDNDIRVATVGKLSEKSLADMMGFLKQHLSAAQIAKINGEPALLEQELVTYFFGDSYEHIAFRAARDLFA